MLCHECGKEVDNDDLFCPECGVKLDNNSANIGTVEPTLKSLSSAESNNSANRKEKELKKSSKRWVIITVSAFVVLVVAIIIVALIIKNSQNNQINSRDEERSEAISKRNSDSQMDSSYDDTSEEEMSSYETTEQITEEVVDTEEVLTSGVWNLIEDPEFIVSFNKDGVFYWCYFTSDNAPTGTWKLIDNNITLEAYESEETLSVSIKEITKDSLTLEYGDKEVPDSTYEWHFCKNLDIVFPYIDVSNIYGGSFTDGVVWIKYKVLNDYFDENPVYKIGLLNKNREIIQVNLPSNLSYNYLNPVCSDGFAYINYYEEDEEKFVIISPKGEITCNMNGSIICGGNGRYLVKQSIRDIRYNYEQYGIIDASSGTWFDGPDYDFMYPKSYFSDFRHTADYFYDGNGFFVAKWTPGNAGRNTPVSVVYDTNKAIITELPFGNYSSVVLGTYNDSLIYKYSDSYSGTVYTLTNGESSQIGYMHYYDWTGYKYNDGMVAMYTDNKKHLSIFDTTGRVIYENYEEYNIENIIITSGGRGAVIVTGADGKYYLVAMITDYNRGWFDPIQLSDPSGLFYGNTLKVTMPNSEESVYVDVSGNVFYSAPELEGDSNEADLATWDYAKGPLIEIRP